MKDFIRLHLLFAVAIGICVAVFGDPSHTDIGIILIITAIEGIVFNERQK